MKRSFNPLQLPKNKFARLSINFLIILIWFYLSRFIYFSIYLLLLNGYGDYFLRQLFHFWKIEIVLGVSLFTLIIFLIPSILLSRIIWFGRIKPRPRITRSKD